MPGKDIRFDGPGRYVVTTKEEVSSDIFELYASKKVVSEQTHGDEAGYQLVVNIKDQTELLSFLNILYDNHHTILKIERLSTWIIDQAYPTQNDRQ